jgi:hypothetical protein
MNPVSPRGCAPTSSGDRRKFGQGTRWEFHETSGATLRLIPHHSKTEESAPARARFTKQIAFGNREVYAFNDAFSVSHLQGGSGHGDFSVDGCAGLSDGLHTSKPREFRAEQCFFDPRESSRTDPDGPDGGNAGLPSSFWRQRTGKTQRPKARSRWWDVVLSCGSCGRVETGHSDAANFACALLRSAIPFQLGDVSALPFSGICSVRLAQRQRHTPRNTPASHLEISLQALPDL